MSDQQVGAQLDALGVTLDLDDNQHLTDVIVLGRLSDAENGETALVIGASAGLDWIAQLGLLAAGRLVAEQDVCES